VAALALGFLVDQSAAPEAVDAAPHGQRVVEQVDVLPLQRQGLGLPQAQGEGDRPAGGVADLRGGFEDGAGLLEVEGGGDVPGPLRRRIDQGGDVVRHVTALDGDGEGAGKDPVVAEH
jgi:hypothetical protein